MEAVSKLEIKSRIRHERQAGEWEERPRHRVKERMISRFPPQTTPRWECCGGVKFGGKILSSVWDPTSKQCDIAHPINVRGGSGILPSLFDTKIKVLSHHWNEDENYDGDSDECNTASVNSYWALTVGSELTTTLQEAEAEREEVPCRSWQGSSTRI